MRKFKGLLIVLLVAAVCVWVYTAHKNSRKPDEFYMEMAVEAAKNNPKEPFGAVIVDNNTGEVLAAGYNMVGESPTYHGEIVAINNCAKKYPHVDWKNTTIFTTAEPCPMCQAAIVWAGISRVVFATSYDYLRQHGWQSINIKPEEVNSKAAFYQGTITGGVLHEKTDALFDKSAPLQTLQLASHP